MLALSLGGLFKLSTLNKKQMINFIFNVCNISLFDWEIGKVYLTSLKYNDFCDLRKIISE